jgi:hypothetical protein
MFVVIRIIVIGVLIPLVVLWVTARLTPSPFVIAGPTGVAGIILQVAQDLGYFRHGCRVIRVMAGIAEGTGIFRVRTVFAGEDGGL